MISNTQIWTRNKEALNAALAQLTSRRNPCTGARRTETTCVTLTCVAPRHEDASRDFLFFYFLRTSSALGGGCQTSSFFFPPCSVDHERDWPTCEVAFFGLATNALNVRNNKPVEHSVRVLDKYSVDGPHCRMLLHRKHVMMCRGCRMQTEPRITL